MEVLGLNAGTVFFHTREGKIGIYFYLFKKFTVRKNSVPHMAFSVHINCDIWEPLSSCNQIEVELCVANGTSLSFVYADRGYQKCLWGTSLKVAYEMS